MVERSSGLGSAALALAALATAAGAARGETLGDAIALAYQSNPTLQAQRANLRGLDESYVQARANYRPTITAQGTVTSETNNCTSSPFIIGGGCKSPSLHLGGSINSSTAGVSISQPLYTGGRISRQVTAAQAQILAGREAVRATEEDTLQNVIQVYVDVRRDQQSRAIQVESVGLLQRQLDESRARFAVGDITRTDVAETEARVAGARAQLAQAEAQLAASRAAYASVVGQNPGTLAPEPSLKDLLPPSLDAAFDIAEGNNPRLRQADFTEQASAARVAAAKAQTRPTVSLQATYSYYGGAQGPYNPFQNYSHDFTAVATATLPLFTGGTTSSQIRQAAEQDNADRIGIETARRQALLTVSQAWSQMLGARANVIADEAQVRSANIAFEGTRQEARVGLRTTLDVLITEQDLAGAQIALVAAKHDEYFAAAALLAALGQLNVTDFAPDTPVYDPKANFDKVRRADAVPWEKAVEAADRLAAPGVLERPAKVTTEEGSSAAGP